MNTWNRKHWCSGLQWVGGSLLCCALAVPTSFASPANGYYHKDTSANFVHYDAVARYGTPIIDGQLGTDKWDASLAQDRYKYDRADNRIRYLFQYDDDYLYVLAQIDDDKLRDDHPMGSANIDGRTISATWETGFDDGLEFYFNSHNSRGDVISSADRVLALTVKGRHYRYDKGNGAGSTAFFAEISPAPAYDASHNRVTGQAASGGATLSFAIGIQGTVNDDSDIDTGYVAEIAMPWAHLGGKPAQPYTSMTILSIENDRANGFQTLINTAALDEPQELDRFYQWFGDGVKGPSAYPRIYLAPAQDVSPPPAITDLSLAWLQPRSALLYFTAVDNGGGNAAPGMNRGYQIRYSTTPISSEAEWAAATVYANRFMPRVAGKSETLRVLGLEPATTYYVAVRAEDFAGNLGGLASLAVTTTAAAANYGKGRIYPAPAGRYFVFEDGSLFTPSPQPAGVNWVGLRDLYTRNLWDDSQKKLVNWSQSIELGYAEAFLKKLAASKVNLLRLFIEDLAFADTVTHPDAPFAQAKANGTFQAGAHMDDGVAWLQMPGVPDSWDPNSYYAESLTFLNDLMQLAAKYGIYVTITPWDNYFYRTDIFAAHPYNVANSGPIRNRDEFVTNPNARQAQKDRLKRLHQVVSQQPNFFGWEMMNEWDNDTFATRAADNLDWLPARREWMLDLVTYLRGLDREHMIFISSVINEPQFALKDFVLRTDYFDFVAIHNYGSAVKDPRAAGDANLTIRPAIDAARMVRYMIGNSVDHRPVYDLEFGPIAVKKVVSTDPVSGELTGYPSDYTQAQDEAVFHNILWAEAGSGLAGAALRWPSQVLEHLGPQLTDGMRAHQQNLTDFFASTQLDLPRLSGEPWERNIRYSGGNAQLEIFATATPQQGLVYLLQDSRRGSAHANGASLTIGGLDVGLYSLEYWSPSVTGGALQRSNVQAIGDLGRIHLNLPNFTQDLALTFKLYPVEKPLFSKRVYQQGDTVQINLPPAKPGIDRYVAFMIDWRNSSKILLLTATNTWQAYTGGVPAWSGGETALLSATAGPAFSQTAGGVVLPPGQYPVLLIEAVSGTEPLSQGAYGLDFFDIQ